jgi:hypothetical protein
MSEVTAYVITPWNAQSVLAAADAGDEEARGGKEQ